MEFGRKNLKQGKETRNNQGKDPRTCEGNSQSGDISTFLKAKARRRTQASLKNTVTEGSRGPLKMETSRRKGGEFRRSGRNRSGRARGEEGKIQKKEMVEGVQRGNRKHDFDEEERKIREKRKAGTESDAPKQGKPGGSLGSGSFSFCYWSSIGEVMVRMQQEAQVKEGRWPEKIPQRWRKPQGADRTANKKEVRVVRCALLNGSAWSTEKKYMRRY